MKQRLTKASSKRVRQRSGKVTRMPRSIAPADLQEVAQLCADLVFSRTDVELGANLAAVASRLSTPRSVIVTYCQPGGPPQTLFHNIDDRAVAATIDLYERGPFRLDPFFLACINDRRQGVFRLSAIAPDNFTRTAYYLDFYRRLRMGEEVGVLLPLPEEAGIIVSLESGAADARFRTIEIEWLSAVFPMLAAAVSQYWNTRQKKVAKADTSIDGLFAGFGKGVLSNRECEVVRLILQGHSSASIAAQLGIAAGTVKMHRKHAYQKLAVSSQAQLFQRFMSTIGTS
ncbi:MAG: helix-turn-helix transcriptional regulator [Gammaproteobacteria bacterium]